MFGRNGMKDRVKGAGELVKEAGGEVATVSGQIVSDEKTREGVMAAVTAALLARQRARRQAGMVGLALRLGSDPVLRGQLVEVATQLRKAQRRVEADGAATSCATRSSWSRGSAPPPRRSLYRRCASGC